jgi:regulatory protein
MDEPPNLPIIAALKHAGRSRHRIIVLDDGREFVFSEEACERAGVAEGQAATDAVFANLEAAEQRVAAHEAALRLLSHRSRSESEMRTRLALRGIESEIVEDEIDRLRSAGLLDDAKFARAWVEDRKRMAPRGRRMLRYELLGRGIEPESVDLVTRDIDDSSIALDLARTRARGSALADYETFLAKVGGFLRRRGFDYAVAGEAARRAWAEVCGESLQGTELAD